MTKYRCDLRYLFIVIVLIFTILEAFLQVANENAINAVKKRHYMSTISEGSSNYSQTAQEKIILLWTRRWGDSNWLHYDKFSKCLRKCRVTSDRKLLTQSDAVLFHAADFTNLSEFPKRRSWNQRWVFVGMESPPHTHAPIHTGRFDGVFNWTVTYRNDSDIVLRWGKYHKRDKIISSSTHRQFLKVAVRNKSRFALARISHCQQKTNHRLDYIKELQKYIHVDIYGKCGDKICPKFTKYCDYELPNLYKFFLGFENSCCRDYITEKLWYALKMFNSVPVVLGGTGGLGREYSYTAPPKSYINAGDFKSAKELARYLKMLDRNQRLYEQYFDWRMNYKIVENFDWCPLCEALYNSSLPNQNYKHFKAWYEDDSCKGNEKKDMCQLARI